MSFRTHGPEPCASANSATRPGDDARSVATCRRSSQRRPGRCGTISGRRGVSARAALRCWRGRVRCGSASGALLPSCLHPGGWRNWQTRTVQVRVSLWTWGFKSPLAHNARFTEFRVRGSFPVPSCAPDDGQGRFLVSGALLRLSEGGSGGMRKARRGVAGLVSGVWSAHVPDRARSGRGASWLAGRCRGC